MKTIGIASVRLSKQTQTYSGVEMTNTMTLHWRADVSNEDEMRGIAVREADIRKPGFSIDEVLVSIVKANHEPHVTGHVPINTVCDSYLGEQQKTVYDPYFGDHWIL